MKKLCIVVVNLLSCTSPQRRGYEQMTVEVEREGKSVSQKISFDVLSGELGIPEASIRDQAYYFSQYLSRNPTEQNLCPTPVGDAPLPRVCSLIAELDGRDQMTAQPTAVGSARIDWRHPNRSQAMHYDRLIPSVLAREGRAVLRQVPVLTLHSGCPRNLSAAAVRRLESLLPLPAAQAGMRKLYQHAAHCLKPEDAGFEILHFRQALLERLWGNHAAAKLAIEKAAAATLSAERARVLYWAGLMGSEAQRQQYWNELVSRFPLSFHALEAWGIMGVDPYRSFAERPQFDVMRGAMGAEEPAQEWLRWLEALYLVDDPDSAMRLSRYILDRFGARLTPQNLMYVSRLKAEYSSPLHTIRILTQGVRDRPEFINTQTLESLFPKPYLDKFMKHHHGVDPHVLLALVRQESAFDRNATSRANAQGLMQVLPSTARMVTRQKRVNLYDVEENIQVGSRFLSDMIERFSSVELALAAYNAGPGRVREWQNRYRTADEQLYLDLIPFAETRNYVSSILRNTYWYKRIYETDLSRFPVAAKRSSPVITRIIASQTGQP